MNFPALSPIECTDLMDIDTDHTVIVHQTLTKTERAELGNMIARFQPITYGYLEAVPRPLEMTSSYWRPIAHELVPLKMVKMVKMEHIPLDIIRQHIVPFVPGLFYGNRLICKFLNNPETKTRAINLNKAKYSMASITAKYAASVQHRVLRETGIDYTRPPQFYKQWRRTYHVKHQKEYLVRVKHSELYIRSRLL